MAHWPLTEHCIALHCWSLFTVQDSYLVLLLQVVGMLKESSHLPAVRAMLDTAHQVLGYDLLAKCVEGGWVTCTTTQGCQQWHMAAP
jgi:hypothetical protein